MIDIAQAAKQWRRPAVCGRFATVSVVETPSQAVQPQSHRRQLSAIESMNGALLLAHVRAFRQRIDALAARLNKTAMAQECDRT